MPLSLSAIVRMNTQSSKLLCDPLAVTLCAETLKVAWGRVTARAPALMEEAPGKWTK